MRDAYVRLGYAGLQVFGPADTPGAVLFVDVEPGADLKSFRQVPYDFMVLVRHVVVREGEEALDRELLRQVVDTGRNVVVLRQPVGKAPSLDGTIPEGEIRDVLRRVRAIELEAMLHWGRAVWEPLDHHYLLPTGRHGATFVKLANAIRGPRDAAVIATWLLHHFDDSGVGLVIDTGTLSAVALAIDVALRKSSKELGRVAVLESYPKTAIGVQRAVRHAAGDMRRAIALLSVNSSGTLRDRLYVALTMGLIERGAIEVLVDQSNDVAQELEPPFEIIETWIPLQKRPLAEAKTYERNCDLCRDNKRAPIVPISPLTFEREYVSQVKAVTPSISDPSANFKFWNLSSQTGALGLEEAPDPHVEAYRPKRMPIHVRMDKLIKNEGFVKEACDRLKAAIEQRVKESKESSEWELVLVPKHDTTLDGFTGFWECLKPAFKGVERYHLFPREGEWDEELKEKIKTARHIAVLTLGVVTGNSLQKALSTIQSSPLDPSYQSLRALVVHARPVGEREWKNVCNAFAGRVDYAWRSFLPSRSVFEEELNILGEDEALVLDEDAEKFREQRRLFCTEGAVSPEMSLFWGSPTNARLSPHSIYGDRLDAVTTFVAVGAAMEAKRHEKLQGPERMVFDLRTMTRSYYDPLILASMMRWLFAHESWWGIEADASGRVIEELLARATDEQRQILVPELLLASAQGKVPKVGIEKAKAYVKMILDKTPEFRGALTLACRLADHHLKLA